MNLPGWSVSLGSLVACLDCSVAFETKEKACPRCGAEVGLFKVENGHAAQLIQAQRQVLDLLEANLVLYSKRPRGMSYDAIWRMVDAIRALKTKAPAGTGAVVTGKEVAAS